MTFGFGMGFPRNMPFSGGPSLNLQLAGNTTLDPRITFSRTSNATLTDSAGNLVYAPHNLLTFSEQFDNSAWTKTNASITANTTVAPDGMTTADSLSKSAAFGQTRQQFTATNGTYTASVYMKAGTEGVGSFAVTENGTATILIRGSVNLSTGVVTNSTGTFTATSVGDGWWRLVGTVTTTTGTNISLLVYSGIFSGTETGTVLVWGAQLNVGALQPYYSTTVPNLLGYSQAFDNAAWTKTRSSISVTKVVAPDGSLTGQSLVEDTTASSTHDLVVSSAFVAGTPVTLSIYAKSNGRNLRVFLPTAAFTVSVSVVFDLAAGTTSVATGTPIATIQNVGNGWYRCGLTATPTTTASGSITFRMLDGSTASYTGDGTSGIFIWGAQLSDSASLDPYVYNPVAAPSSVAYYGPRFDYDPTTLQPLGLLIEEQRTNSNRNNTMVGAVVGTPGTPPTNWSVTSVANGITREIVAIGVEDGINYIDMRFFGTASATSNHSVTSESTTQIAASSGQSWSGSAYLRLIAGSLNNLTVSNRVNGRSAAGLPLETVGNTSLTPTSAALRTQRAVSSGTLANALSVFVTQQVIFAYNSGAVVEATFRIGLPQLELGAFATSVIPTTTAAATRAADVAKMIGDNFSNWYNPTAGTLFATASVMYDVGTNIDGVASLDDNTASNRIQIRRNSATQLPTGLVVTVGTTQFNSGAVGASTAGAGVVFSIGLACATNSAVFGDRGLLSTTDTTVTLPTVTQLQIGDGAGIVTLNGHIQQIAYYPRRLGNAELQSLTV